MTQDFVYASIIILCCLGYICAAKRFCKEYLEISQIKEKLFAVICFCAWAFMNMMYESQFIPDIFLTLLQHLFFMGLVLLLFQGGMEKKILAVSVLLTITTLAENFFVSLFSCITLLWLHTVNNISIPVLGKGETNLILVISIMIVIRMIHLISKCLACVFYCKTRKWYIILSIPLLANTILIDIANWGASNGILVRSGGNMGLYYDQLLSYAEFCVLTTLSMFATGFYVFGMQRIYLERKKSSQYHLQITAYKLLEEQYRQSERLRHDLKNHIIALSGLMENKEWEKMKCYLKQMESSADLGIGEDMTGNRIVDVLLYQKRKIAERKNILWECDVQIPQICSMNEFDLCVLFGNILDNAVEACERLQHNESYSNRPQFINIQAGAVKKCFLLEVKNSSDLEDVQKNGFTRKENPEEHGIGILNIKDVIHKYNGVMNIEVSNGIFVISVLIPLSDTVHDMKQVI